MKFILLFLLLIFLSLALYSYFRLAEIRQKYPPIGRQVELKSNGLTMHYRDEGWGPVVVLLHGSSSNLREMWFALAKPLLQRNWRVIAVDRPGFGHSMRASGEWQDPSKQMAAVTELLKQIGVDEAWVIGHSWAGALVLSGLLEHPEIYQGGVLLAGAMGQYEIGLEALNRFVDIPVLGPIFTHTLLLPAGEFLLEARLQSVFAPNPVPEKYLEDGGIKLIFDPKTFRINAEEYLKLSSYLAQISPRYSEIKQPVLFFWGDEDELVPAWNHLDKFFPIFKNAEVQHFPNTGHALHHVHQEEIATKFTQFAHSHP